MSLEVHLEDASAPEPERGAFYFDLRSPEAYLAAERVLAVLPVVAEWIPVRSQALPGADTWEGFRCATDREVALGRIEETAAARQLQPVRWPDPFPFDSELALRAATYAKEVGRVVAFAQACFRQVFAGGRVPDETTVLVAGAACEMHPRALLQAVERDAIVARLDAATELAAQRGVRDVPAIWLPDGRVLHGDAALEEVPAP
ncbi:DsbA family protein [Conexibacter sp. SYSU D00693]|uniref:DsbA family protein n=1 Tax=Conexibacter sp. SYSU D00693 TaxID=2812560 RepID=UPI00196A4DD6|nr:DsbA family protein [Conexibacter sp. SYSU D00693]